MKTALKWVACMILCGVLLTLGVFSDAPAGDNVSDSPEQSARPGYTETVRYIEPAKGAFQIHDQQDARFGLQFNVEAETPVEYRLRYSLDGTDYIETTFRLGSCKDKTLYFPIPVKKGRYDMHIQVTDQARVVYDQTHTLVYMDDYTEQYMDAFTKWGLCTHMDRAYYSSEDFALIEKAGVQYVRESPEWQYIEKIPSVFDYKPSYAWYIDELNLRNIKILPVAAYNNTKYFDKGDTRGGQIGLYNQKQREKYVDFTYSLMDTYQTHNSIEMWNEPNIQTFWRPEPDVVNYSKLIKTVYPKIKEKNWDETAFGCSTAGTDINFMKDVLELGGYPYMDGISFHPYVWPGRPDNKGASVNNIDRVKALILEYGGWKKMSVTEVGWPVSAGQISYAQQAQNVVKQLAVTDAGGVDSTYLYDYKDDGDDPNYTEHHFGLVDYDRTPKQALIALTEMLRLLGGAVPHGRVDLGLGDESYAYLYAKEKQPVIMAWMAEGQAEYAFGPDAVVFDMYGNRMDCKEAVTLTQQPVYIQCSGNKWFQMTAQQRISTRQEEWMNSYGSVLKPKVMLAAKSTFQQSLDLLSGEPGENGCTAAIDALYQLGEQVILVAKAGDAALLDVSKALYQLYEISDVWANLLQVTGEPPLPDVLASREAVEKISQEASRLYLSEGFSKKYSDGILRFARQYQAKAEAVAALEENPARNGIAAAWVLQARRLCEWYKELSQIERAENLNYIITWPLADRSTYLDQEKVFRFEVENRSAKPLAGRLEILDENGRMLAKTQDTTISPGQSQALTTVKDLKMAASEQRLTINLVADGKIVKQETGTIQNRDIASMQLKPVHESVETLKQLDLVIENLFDVPQTVHLDVTCSDITFGAGRQTVRLEGKEKRTVPIPVSSIRRSSYNHYVVDVKLTNEKGNVIARQNQPLSFALAAKAEQPIDVLAFDGNVAAWEDAYPIYINPPEQADTKAAWEAPGFKARAMLKWDASTLYILADVYDQKHLQESSGGDIWNGDSLQLAIDRKGDRAASYQDDDLELGAALSSRGILNYIWNPSAEQGVVQTQFASVLRSETKGITRYLIAVPKERLAPLELRERSEIGLNLAVNDANVLSREAWYEFTPGLASTKNPSAWETFALLPQEKSAEIQNKGTAALFETELDRS